MAQRGAPATRPEPQAKTGSLPELVPRFREADPLKNSEKKRERPPRNPRACSGRRPTAMGATRDVPACLEKFRGIVVFATNLVESYC